MLFPFSARRFTLGERRESGLPDVLEECIDAAYSKHKRARLNAANRRLPPGPAPVASRR